MKTAEEWIAKSVPAMALDPLLTKSIVHLIQLDAWKQGMTDAAEIVGKDIILQKRPTDWGILRKKAGEILAARDLAVKV